MVVSKISTILFVILMRKKPQTQCLCILLKVEPVMDFSSPSEQKVSYVFCSHLMIYIGPFLFSRENTWDLFTNCT